MNARLAARLLRPERQRIHSDTPRALLDCFDRMDPTRSHELRPSVRFRNARQERRLFRTLLLCVGLTATLVGCFSAWVGA